MAKPRKYEQGGKTMSLYMPNQLRSEYESRAALLGMTRNELIIKVLQGRAIENLGSSPANNEREQVEGTGDVPVASSGDSATGSPGDPSACSHPSLVNLGFLKRCRDCGVEV